MSGIKKMNLDSEDSNLSSKKFDVSLTIDVNFRLVVGCREVLNPILKELVSGFKSILVIRTEVRQEVLIVDKDVVARFDILCLLDDGSYCDVELQVRNKPPLIKRARMYQSIGDVLLQDTNHGHNYNIGNSTVIFLCSNAAMPISGRSIIMGSTKFDVFDKEGKVINHSVRDGVLDDGREMIFLNYKLLAEKSPLPNVQVLCKYLCSIEDSNSELGIILKDKMAKLSFKEGRDSMLTEQEKIRIADENLQKGRIEGREKSIENMAKGLMKDFGWSKEKAMQYAAQYILSGI